MFHAEYLSIARSTYRNYENGNRNIPIEILIKIVDFYKVSLGYKEDEKSDPSDMNEYYSKEDEERYGVVGIELKLK